MWSVKQAIRLCGLGEERSLPNGYGIVLDKEVVDSIRVAVDRLNDGIIACPQGVCTAYSASHQAYHLLYRSDLRDRIQSDFKGRTASMSSDFAILDGAWSTKNVLRLCADGEELPYIDNIMLLDTQSITSVMDAVCKLNRGDVECPDGCCMVYSASRRTYYLLYHCQMKRDVLSRFRPGENGGSTPVYQRSLGRSPSTSFSVSDAGGETWSSKRVVRLCGEGEESLFAGRAVLVPGSLSVNDAVAKLNRGDVDCPDGFCVAYSASRKAYFLLFRAGLRDIAIATCKGDMDTSFASSTPVSFALPAVCAPYYGVMSPKSRPGEIASWSSKQVYRVCPEGEDEWRFRGRVQVIDKSQMASVSEAVQMLQDGHVCAEGLCMIFSAKQRSWYLLYRADMKQDAIALLADIGYR